MSQKVCLFVTRRYYVETAKHIVDKSFSHSDIAKHSFSYQTVWQYSDEDPLTGTVMKNLAF